MKDNQKKARNRGIRGTWSAENMQRAIEAVRNGMSVNSASKTFLVPRGTLRDYLRKNQREKCSMGRKPVLSEQQERELSGRVLRLAEVGYPLTSKVLRHCVFNFCEANRIENPFNKNTQSAGRVWLKGFLNRHREIRNRKAQNMNPARAQKLNKFIVNDHFEKLRQIMTQLDIMDRPECIYNMDEKGCRLSLHHQQSVLAKKGAKRVHLVANEHGQNVTIVSCGNTIGTAIPPLVLYKGKRMKPEWTDSLPPGSLGLMTAKGSMTIETFKRWLHHFANYKVGGPSDTTHELQPMDKAVFRSFEYSWDEEVLKYWAQHKDRSLTKQRFGSIFSTVWDKCMTPSNIKSGFAATGIYPFNPDIIPVEAFAPSSVTELTNTPEVAPNKINQPSTRQLTTPSSSTQRNALSRVTTPPAGPSNKPAKKRRAVVQSQSSDSDQTDNNSTDEHSSEEDKDEHEPSEESSAEGDISLTKMLSTPDMAHKYETRQRKPAINSRAQVVTKVLFNKTDLAGNTSTPKSKFSASQQKRVNMKQNNKSWYCKACKEDRIADMRFCVICTSYLHDECLGLTKDDPAGNFICPYCC